MTENDLVVLLTAKPYTLDELCKLFRRSERTMRRWLEVLQSQGHQVARLGVYPTDPYCILSQTGTEPGDSRRA
jgi:hypothetical protein